MCYINFSINDYDSFKKCFLGVTQCIFIAPFLQGPEWYNFLVLAFSPFSLSYQACETDKVETALTELAYQYLMSFIGERL